jgi:hypothetical protein
MQSDEADTIARKLLTETRGNVIQAINLARRRIVGVVAQQRIVETLYLLADNWSLGIG